MAGQGIIVLGAFRSGTSLLTNLVRMWGGYVGETDRFSQADHWNESGYWEYHPLRRFNSELLKSVNANARVPPDDAEKEQLRQKAHLPEYREQALALITTMEQGADGRPWVWKDPQLPLLLPFWTQIWEDVRYLITLRHPVDIGLSAMRMIPRVFDKSVRPSPAAPTEQQSVVGMAALVERSLAREQPQQQQLPVAGTLLYWQRVMLEALSFTEHSPQRLFIRYEQLVRNPLTECRRLCAFLDDGPSDAAVVDLLAGSIKPELAHFRESTPLSALPEATEGQRALAAHLEQLLAGETPPFEQHLFPLPTGWREILQQLNSALEQEMKHRGLES